MMNKISLANLLRAVIRRFDKLLIHLHQSKIFTTEHNVIIRIQVDRLSHPISLPEGIIPAGAKAVYLHLWNERLPSLPSGGVDLSYARNFYQLMLCSLEALGQYLQTEESLKDVDIVGGVTSHVLFSGPNNSGSSMLRRLGFTLSPYPHPLKKFGLFFENFYTWVLMWTFNPVTLQSHNLFKMQRIEGWIGTADFLDRYGSKKNSHEAYKNLG